MLAHQNSAVTTVFPHPRWCTEDHRNATASLHQSPEMLLGHVAGIPVKVERIHIDPEPGHPDPRDEMWISFGQLFTEVPLDEAAAMADQLRRIAASLDLIIGGA